MKLILCACIFVLYLLGSDEIYSKTAQARRSALFWAVLSSSISNSRFLAGLNSFHVAVVFITYETWFRSQVKHLWCVQQFRSTALYLLRSNKVALTRSSVPQFKNVKVLLQHGSDENTFSIWTQNAQKLHLNQNLQTLHVVVISFVFTMRLSKAQFCIFVAIWKCFSDDTFYL